jgi:hypothetical protein
MARVYCYRTIDKSIWGDGPWQKEPDKVQWTDRASGLPCLAVRNAMSGHWCGYVGVSEAHSLFGVDYNDDRIGLLPVHGGVTFTNTCMEDSQETGVCHIPEPGETDKVWWLGFDCAHCDDFRPGASVYLPSSILMQVLDLCRDEQYRTLRYVRQECRFLALQLAAIKTDVEVAS